MKTYTPVFKARPGLEGIRGQAFEASDWITAMELAKKRFVDEIATADEAWLDCPDRGLRPLRRASVPKGPRGEKRLGDVISLGSVGLTGRERPAR